MQLLLKEVRPKPILWLLGFVPVVFTAAEMKPEAHTLHFVLSVLAIVPLAVPLGANVSKVRKFEQHWLRRLPQRRTPGVSQSLDGASYRHAAV